MNLSAVLVAAILGTLGVTAAALWARCRLLIATVRGPSMEPALWHGDRVWVRRGPRRPLRAGQVVLVMPPSPLPAGARWRDNQLVVQAGRWPADLAPPRERWLIKRIAAVGGDPTPDVLAGPVARPGERVPPGQLVVLGDNPGRSYDSREFGYLPADAVRGVVLGQHPPGGDAG